MANFQFLALSGMTEYQKQELFYMIRSDLGEPVVGVELEDSNLEVSFVRGIREYSHYINQWAMNNRMSQMLGLTKDIDFTLKYITHNLSLEQSFARAYSEQVGVGINSTREQKTDVINLTAGTQNYYIPANREIVDVLWYTPNFINLFGLNGAMSDTIAYQEFGASFAGNPLYSVMPVFDTLLNAQAAELRNKIRASEYSYMIVGGPNGTKKITFYPIPRTPSQNFGMLGISTPGTVFYKYYDTVGVAGNSQYSGYTANPGYTGSTQWTQGNGLVSGPSDAKLDYLTYNELNSNAQYWVQKFAFAHAARVLGLSIRGKFGGELPIPDATLKTNSDALMALADKEIDKLKEDLKAELELLNYKTLLENNAAMQESINTTLKFVPLGIFLG